MGTRVQTVLIRMGGRRRRGTVFARVRVIGMRRRARASRIAATGASPRVAAQRRLTVDRPGRQAMR